MHLECPKCKEHDRKSDGFILRFSMVLDKDLGVLFDNGDYNLYVALLSGYAAKYDRYIQDLRSFDLECRTCGFAGSAFFFIVEDSCLDGKTAK